MEFKKKFFPPKTLPVLPHPKRKVLKERKKKANCQDAESAKAIKTKAKRGKKPKRETNPERFFQRNKTQKTGLFTPGSQLWGSSVFFLISNNWIQ